MTTHPHARSIEGRNCWKGFFERCLATVEGALAAFDSVAELGRERQGSFRISSLVLLTQRCLAHESRWARLIH
jgi:hypothetical protein